MSGEGDQGEMMEVCQVTGIRGRDDGGVSGEGDQG